MLQLTCKRCEIAMSLDISGRRSRLGTGGSGSWNAPEQKKCWGPHSKHITRHSGGGSSPSPSSLEVQITSKTHLLRIWKNLYDNNKTYIVALQRKWNKNKINMLVHICHSMSFTETMCDHRKQKALQTDAAGTLTQGDIIQSSALCGSYQTAHNRKTVMSAFYTGPLAGSDSW